MPKPAPSRPRAPSEVTGRVSASGTGGRPRAVRMRLTAWPRSGAVSAKVPSRSNSTARIIGLSAPACKDVIDAGIRFERVGPGERVVGHAGDAATRRGRALRHMAASSDGLMKRA